MRRNRPSRTALQIGQAVVLVGGDPEISPLLPAGLVETTVRLLAASGRVSERKLRRLGEPLYRRVANFLGDLMGVPGQMLHVALRKRLVTEEVTAALAGGCRQVLVLGAGLDTLALRLAPAHPESTFVEVDHPASQALKQRALARLGTLPANLQLVPLDLGSSDLVAALSAAGAWDASAPGVVVAEGVLMYLEPTAVARLLGQLHAAGGAGSVFLFSYLRRDAAGRLLLGKRPRLAGFSLALGGEPLRWSVGSGELAGFLAAVGWRLEVERFDLRERYLRPADLAARPLGEIEHYALARRV
ncbi:MAG TPA: SAM-dependent methyltransferase [Thermoanaerobaculia bacterium]|nr:SAM-dependent methyltransferase [Thermoanaerobaculia bacterium]